MIKRMPGQTLTPVRPSAAITASYQKRLERAVDQMARGVQRDVLAGYRANAPHALTVYGMDASPARILSALCRRVTREWLRRFDDLAPKLAAHFATDVRERNDRTLRADLKRAGFTVPFKMTKAMNDVVQGVVAEQTSLISSIPEQHMRGVETLVLQSVQAGRDLATLAKGLEDRHNVTRRRAAFIAKQSNNNATAQLMRARQLALGITKGRWLHSAGGKVPRVEHVAFSGRTFDLASGHDFDNGEGAVLPGQALNCRCTWTPVVPGLDD